MNPGLRRSFLPVLHHFRNFRKHPAAQTGKGLVPYYKLISNIMPRDDQTAFESLRNVLVKGTHKSEDLLITVFLEGKISSLVWQFLHVQFEWNMVREICVLEAASWITILAYFFFNCLRTQCEAPAHTQKLYCKCKYCSCLKTKLYKQKRSLTTNILRVELIFDRNWNSKNIVLHLCQFTPSLELNVYLGWQLMYSRLHLRQTWVVWIIG